MAAISAAPLLPLEGVTGVIYSGPFVEMVQEALIAFGYDVGPGGVDGKYGPATAAALRAFQDANQAAKDKDRVPQIGYRVAGCATYQALGLPVMAGYCRGNVSAPGDVCEEVMRADAAGEISLSCVGGPAPAGPSFRDLLRDLWGTVKPYSPVLGGALLAGVIFLRARK